MINLAMETKKDLLAARKQLIKDNENLIKLNDKIQANYKKITDSYSYLYKLEKINNKYGYNDYNYIDSILWNTLFKKTNIDAFLTVENKYLLDMKYNCLDRKDCSNTPIFNAENIKKIFNKTYLFNELKNLTSYVIDKILKENSTLKNSFKVTAFDTSTDYNNKIAIDYYYYYDRTRYTRDFEKLACIANNINYDIDSSLLYKAAKNSIFDTVSNDIFSIKIQLNNKTVYKIDNNTLSAFKELQKNASNIKNYLD